MKTRIWMAAMVAMSISSPAPAWMSTFYDRTHGGSFTYADAETPEDAKRLALQGCVEKAPDTDCVELGRPAHGTTIVIGLGTKKSANDVIFQREDPDPDKAAREVLSDCRKVAKGCHLTLAMWDIGYRWAALALNPDGTMFLASDMETREVAESRAIRGCEKQTTNKGKCRAPADLVTSIRAWYAFARSEKHIGAGMSNDYEQYAKQQAMDFCRKGADGSLCKITEVFENPGPTPAPPSFATLKARIEREKAQRNAAARKQMPKKVGTSPVPNGEGNCRPSGNTLRCTSQCSNGNCLVTYENGCKLRVQVQPKFNPFNNQWDYPAPGC